jgi:cytochrome c oxidase assembly factor CtaG
MQLICSIVFLLSVFPERIYAHSSSIEVGENWWLDWTFPPFVTSNLVILSILFAVGSSRTISHNRKDTFCFTVGAVVLAVALLSPVDAYSDLLAYMHMIQHMLIMMVAAPLLVSAAPSRKILLALPPRLRRITLHWRKWLTRHTDLKNAFSNPILIWVIFGATLWIAHLPRLYEAALNNEFLHDLQHLVFFVTSFLFWTVLLNPVKSRRIPVGIGLLFLFVASIHTIVLGVFMALSPKVWYPTYTKSSLLLHTAQFDQQIAGYIMWMPSCMMYASIALALIYFRLVDRKNFLQNGVN